MSKTKCIRFELEYEDGHIARLSGQAAEAHLRALNAACLDVHIHGRPIPKAEFEVVRAARASRAPGEALDLRVQIEALAETWERNRDAAHRAMDLPGVSRDGWLREATIALCDREHAIALRSLLASASPARGGGDDGDREGGR